MSEESATDPDLNQLKTAVREAVESGRDLQVRVRDLLLTALSSARVDMPRIRQTVRATLEGVETGAATHGAGAGDAAREAVAGIEDALKHAAEASSLAIREAAGNASEFARTDLRRAVDDLATLEKQFIDILADVVKAGSAGAEATFADIQRHFRNSGTAFSEQLAIHVGSLRQLLSQAGQESMQSGVDAAGKAAEQLGRLAGALLSGIEKGFAEAGTTPGRRDDTDSDNKEAS